MSTLESRCLDAFPEWLRTLAGDAVALSALVADERAPEELRRRVAGTLNYLFKSLDLIPDGIDDLGFLDDAIVFRVAARLAAPGGDGPVPLPELAREAALVEEFLGADHERLVRFVDGLASSTARGRSAADIATDPALAAALASDVKGWAAGYSVPSFARDAKNLVKLKAFLSKKLPA